MTKVEHSLRFITELDETQPNCTTPALQLDEDIPGIAIRRYAKNYSLPDLMPLIDN
jgi:hypothetical protein